MIDASRPEKTRLRRILVREAMDVLGEKGWTISKARGFGKSRVRRITRNGKSKLAAIRTSQDAWIAFPRTRDDTKWATLADVDVVVVASVDPEDSQFARIHMIDANEMRDRFDRAYAARLAAGHTIPSGRGVWVALYENDVSDPVTLVGAGAGIANKAIARVSLAEATAPAASVPDMAPVQRGDAGNGDEESLTIADAKARLARTLGVDPSSIKIIVEA